MNARARIAAAFFGHSVAHGAEQDRALAPSASPRVLLDFPARALTGAPA